VSGILSSTDATGALPTPEGIAAFWDRLASERDYWKRRNAYFHADLKRFYKLCVPAGASVLEVGCGMGDLLASLGPSRGVGIDISPGTVEIAKGRYPHLEFRVMDAEHLQLEETFDYVVVSQLVSELVDVQRFFDGLRSVLRPESRVLVDSYSHLWEGVLMLASRMRLRMPHREQNWLSREVIEEILNLCDYEVIRVDHRFLCPKKIPVLAQIANHGLVKLPGFRHLGLLNVLIARPLHLPQKRLDRPPLCSVVVPCRNEKGNIEELVKRVPKMGGETEIVFIDGNSGDGTVEEIRSCMHWYREKPIRLIEQGGALGKGDAVRKGFAAARGEVLMILDADLTVAPEDLPKFYEALVFGKGEFVNGTRMVYPMRQGAMRFMNMVANKFFGYLFTWLLGQPYTDTLCGTKALARRDYEKIARGRPFFGDFDPFGDFDLIFGASRLNLKTVEIPVRYRERIYGQTKISRFRHGWLLLKMSWNGFWKLKWV
jgi:SAM-dependent methyltransferase